METRKPNNFRFEGLETNGVDQTRLKFVADDLARKACRVPNGVSGYKYATVNNDAIEIVCVRPHCGFDPYRFVTCLTNKLEALVANDSAPDELETGPDVSDGADFDVYNTERQ